MSRKAVGPPLMAYPTTHPQANGDGHLQSHYEPQGRSGHWSTLINGKVFMWGGYFRVAGTPDDHCSFVDIYDPTSQTWTQQKTSGSPPVGVHGAACVGISLYLNVFAGGNPKAGEYYNSVHQLDTLNLIWTEMMAMNSQDAPMKKCNASMVSYSDSQLVTLGGYGKLPENPQPYVDYIADMKQSYEGLGWTNELGVFNLTSRTWSWPSTTGGRPPPCQGHSFTRVDQSRAVVYGGEQLYECVPSNIHILEMQSWVWNTVTGGAPGQPWPAARVLHTAVSLHEAESEVIDPSLLVMWGEGENEHIFSDSWIFIVNAQQWRKMVMPDSLRGRFLHTTTLLHTDDTHKQLVAHGGLNETSDDNAYLDTLVPMADTTVVEIDSSGPSGDWMVTDIIPFSQLGCPTEKDSSTLQVDGCPTEKDSSTLNDIVKREPKTTESSPHVEEPQSSEVKDKKEQQQASGDGKVEEFVPVQKMRQLQLAYIQLHDEYEELVDYIINSEPEDTRAIDSMPYEQLKSQETTIVASENVKKTQYLRGVEVTAETQFVIKGTHSQTFEWKEHGLKLSIPEDLLPSDQTECVIDIKASSAGQYEFPKGTQLVSSVYWLSCQQKFQHSVTLEINHCATIQSQTECSYLRFIAARCSQKELPYKFKLLSKGVFSPGSSYGSIDVKQFSLYGTVIDPTVELSDQFIQPPSQQYFAQIYYMAKGVNRWQLDFVVTWNLEDRIKAIRHQYSHPNVEVGPHLEVEFDSKEISLSIPKYGITLENGWAINPLTPPVVSKRQVDSFLPGTRVPSCQLSIEWVKDESPVRLNYVVDLEGAKEPYNFFAINPLIREHSVGEKRKQELQDTINDHGMQQPTLEELLDNVWTTKWFRLGLKLGVQEDTLEAIERDRSLDASRALVDMLRKWLRQCEDPTWVALVCAMRQIGEGNSAKKLEDKFC